MDTNELKAYFHCALPLYPVSEASRSLLKWKTSYFEVEWIILKIVPGKNYRRKQNVTILSNSLPYQTFKDLISATISKAWIINYNNAKRPVLKSSKQKRVQKSQGHTV